MARQSKQHNDHSFLNDLIRSLHAQVGRYRGKVRHNAFVAGNCAGIMMASGVLLSNLEQPHTMVIAWRVLIVLGGILAAIVMPAKLIFGTRRNWIAWAIFPASLCSGWLVGAALVESWQLAVPITTVPARFMVRFQPMWLTALGVSVVLGAVRWIFDGIYDSWPSEMKNPAAAPRSSSPESINMAIKSEMRFGIRPQKTKIRFTPGKPMDTNQAPPRSRPPHGRDGR